MIKSVLLTVGCFILLITCNLITPMNGLPMKDENSMGRVKRNILKSQASSASSASATDTFSGNPLSFTGSSSPFGSPYGNQQALLQKLFSALGLGSYLNELLGGLGSGVVGSRPSGFFPGGIGLGQSPLLSLLSGSFAQSDSSATAIGR